MKFTKDFAITFLTLTCLSLLMVITYFISTDFGIGWGTAYLTTAFALYIAMFEHQLSER
jgi:hypothetical protein